MNRTLSTGIIILFLYGIASSQIVSDKAIKIGFGPAFQFEQFEEAPGFVVSVGLQKNVWKDRVRVNPNFIFGQFNNFFFSDTRDISINSNSFQLNGEFDAIRRGMLSIVFAVGGYANMVQGYKGSHLGRYWQDNEDTILVESKKKDAERVMNYHVGVNASWGFRINPPNRRIALEIMPINVMIGTNLQEENHKEYCAKINLSIKI